MLVGSLLLITSLTTPALAEDAKPLEFAAVVDATGTADVLYKKARAWYSTAFRNADAVLDLEDASDHKLVGKGTAPFSQSFLSGKAATEGVIRYVVTVQTKDGRYRATVGSFDHDASSPDAGVDFGRLNSLLDPGQAQCSPPFYCSAEKWRTKVWAELKASAEAGAQPLLSSLQTAMTAKADDNW